MTEIPSAGLPRRRAAAILALAPLLAVLALLAFFAVEAPHFLDWPNLTAILRQSAPLLLLGAGLAVVVIGGGDDVVWGGVDLSVPAGAVLAAAVVSQQIAVAGNGLGTALMLGLPAALLVGAVNALLVVRIRLTPLLATLATSVAAAGLTKLVTSNRRINVAHSFVDWLRDGEVFGLPVSFLLAGIAVGALTILVHRTAWGQHLQAIGASRPVAESAGLPIDRMVATSYMLAAGAGAAAALTLLARGSGSSPGSEEPLLLEMVLGTFLGAAFSRRRVVTVGGAALGAVLVSALSNGFALLQVDIFWTGGIKGALILAVLLAAVLQERRR